MSESHARQRIGIFGGSFDPIHLGHLLLAECARESLGLSEVRFLPASTSPLKQNQQPSDGKQRLEMVQLATGGNPHFHCDDRELRRGGASYTVDTLAELAAEMPDAELVFLMGADSLADFHRWREPERICKLAFVAVLNRGGQASPDISQLAAYLPEESTQQLQQHLVPMPQVEISSSELRDRIAAGKSIRYQVHPAVAAFIQASQLYRRTG